ncbi:MAG: hypothetical protein ACKO8R_04265 [Candidatus Fonsibacter sp.]
MIEITITIILAMITSLLPTLYNKITDNTDISNSTYIIIAALIMGILTACFIYSLLVLGVLETLYYLIIYLIILGAIFLTQYLVKLNSK